MKDQDKTQKQLIKELTKLRHRIAELEQSKIERKRADETLRESEEQLRLKPDSILLPETDIGEQELANIIDVPSIQTMVDEFHKLTGMGVWILDLKGTVLVGVGWQDICTKYHRIHPQTARNCIESDLYLSRNLRSGEYIAYKCKNGMTDVVTPLYIGGKHIGNIYTGQFFYKDEDVDVGYFAAQATQYGFERESYLEALRRVPRFDRDSVRTLMDFLVKFTTLVSKMGYSNLNLTKAIYEQKRVEEELRKHREHLEELVKERTAELESEITGRKRAEEGLKESEQRFRALFDNTPDGIVLADPENKKFTMGNETFCQMLGYNSDEIQNLGVMDIHPAEEVKHSADQFEKLLRKEIPVAENIPAKRKDGSIFFVDIRAFLVSLAGKTYLAGIFRDITERKRAEDALRESESRFKRLYDSNIIGVIFWDTTGNISQANDEFLRIVGYTEDDVLSGKVRWKDMTPPEYAYLDEKAIKEMTETGISAPFEKEYIRKDGSRVPIRLNAALLKGEKNIGICFIQDITERKQAEEELRKSLADLERSNKELEQFAYVASHDLQEPLRMVSSYTQLLERRYKDKLDADAKEFIAYAVDGANRMQRLIQDLLAYSRVSSRGRSLTPTDCNTVLGQVRINLSVAIEENNAIVTHDELPFVLADETQLVQVFLNLIGNAIKFHAEEPPRIHVSAEKNKNEWIFSVRDNGEGIDPQYHDRVFVIFQRLHAEEEYPGTGIGLAICKRIVERHGGRIWLESKPGKGSTFYFTIPVRGGERL